MSSFLLESTFRCFFTCNDSNTIVRDEVKLVKIAEKSNYTFSKFIIIENNFGNSKE